MIGGGVRSLAGVERMQRLSGVRIQAVVEPDLGLLAELPRLESLVLVFLRGEVDFSPLARCRALKSVYVSFKSEVAASGLDVAWGELSKLEELDLINEDGDGVPIDLGWVAGAKSLRHLVLTGFISANGIGDLMVAKQLRALSFTTHSPLDLAVVSAALPDATVLDFIPERERASWREWRSEHSKR